MIQSLAYACQAHQKDSGCVHRKVSIIRVLCIPTVQQRLEQSGAAAFSTCGCVALLLADLVVKSLWIGEYHLYPVDPNIFVNCDFTLDRFSLASYRNLLESRKLVTVLAVPTTKQGLRQTRVFGRQK